MGKPSSLFMTPYIVFFIISSLSYVFLNKSVCHTFDTRLGLMDSTVPIEALVSDGEEQFRR